MTSASSLMSGRVLLKLIQDERAGKFEGDDVQIIPHLTVLSRIGSSMLARVMTCTS